MDLPPPPILAAIMLALGAGLVVAWRSWRAMNRTSSKPKDKNHTP